MASARVSLRAQTRSKPSVSADDKLALRVWLRLLNRTQMVERDIRSLLRRRFDTTLPRFDVLAALDSNNGVLQMGELSERLKVTTGNTTGLIDLMEQDGLVERMPHPTDRRSTLIQMTAAGEALFAKAMPEHQFRVQDIFDSLSPAEQRQLYDLLGKIDVPDIDDRASAARGSGAERRRVGSR